jgi:peptide deformylase
MILKIVQTGEPVLRQRAHELTPDEIRSRRTQDLIELMRKTMYDAPGVGLAAPQVALPLQLAVIEDKPEYTRDIPPEILASRGRQPVPFHVIINPKITLHDGPRADFFEGCLSVAGFTAVVSRAARVTVDCLDHKGEPKHIEASGWYARILQHEIDHLHGTLYIDRMQTRSYMSLDNFNRHWKEKPLAEVQEILNNGPRA